jgi:hypothetical protein
LPAGRLPKKREGELGNSKFSASPFSSYSLYISAIKSDTLLKKLYLK